MIIHLIPLVHQSHVQFRNPPIANHLSKNRPIPFTWMQSQLDSFLVWYQQTLHVESLKGGKLPAFMQYLHITPVVGVCCYIIMLLVLPKIVKKGGFKIDGIFALWNLFLSLMSLCILLGVGIPIYFRVKSEGFFEVVCDPNGDWFNQDGTMLFWMFVFTLSKYFELLDTFFLIVKNPERPLEFLHWYHHLTVLLFTWYALAYRLSVGIFFGSVNAGIHTFMYGYYFFAAVGYKPPTWIAFFLTLGQIFQMFFGIFVNFSWAKMWFDGKNCTCDQPTIILISAAIMYGSYLYLFIVFFIKKYFGKKERPVTETKKKE
jgi:elongation of very long chain fatty acids protein 6